MAQCSTATFQFLVHKPPEERLYYKAQTEDPRHEYSPGGGGVHHYAPNMPYSIDTTYMSVEFWTTPVFRFMWYTQCGESPETALYVAKSYTKPSPYTESRFCTGIIGKDAAEAAGMQCYGSHCGTQASSILFGSLRPPLGAALAGVFETGEYRTVKFCRYELGRPPSVDAVNAVMALTYDGRNTAAFIPEKPAHYLVFLWAVAVSLKPGIPQIFLYPDVAAQIRKYSLDLYTFILDATCHGKLLKHGFCRTFCGDTDTNCDERHEKYCKALGPKDALSADNADICGCFMGTQFYKGYFDTLRAKFNFPVTAPPSHTCYFDQCAASNVKPYAHKQNPAKCPDVLNCFQNVNVVMTAGGTLETGDITIKPTQQCLGNVQQKCAVQTDCRTVPNSTCRGGVCFIPGVSPDEPVPPTPPAPQPVPPQPVCRSSAECPQWAACSAGTCVPIAGECSATAQCLGRGTCVGGKCVPAKTDFSRETAVLIVAAAAALVVIL